MLLVLLGTIIHTTSVSGQIRSVGPSYLFAVPKACSASSTRQGGVLFARTYGTWPTLLRL